MNGKKTIVIVDPNIKLIEDLQRRFMLEPDYKIIGVSTSGNDGFARIQAQQPHFAIIASPLPDMDVLNLLNSLGRAQPQVIKIVTMEVKNDSLASQYMQAGATHVLVKPYTADDLIAVMKRIEYKTPAYAQEQQYNMPNYGMEQTLNQAEGFSASKLREAMQQFAQWQEQREGQGNQGNFNQGYQNFNQFEQQQYTQQQYPQQPYSQQPPYYQQQQFGPGFGAPFPPQQSPMMGAGYGQMGHGMEGGFPPPQMGQMGGGFVPPQNVYVNTSVESMPEVRPLQQGGFRTIRQTIIAVNCPKGGVGKTTVSKELALAYSTVKISGQPLKVCLVDCDLDFGDVATVLRMRPHPNISYWTSEIVEKLRQGVPKEQIRYTQQQIEKFLITHPATGLKVLAAPTDHQHVLDVTYQVMEIVLENLKNCDFDIIILDTGNNTKDYTIIALERAHIVLMVATYDVTTIENIRELYNTLRSFQFPMNKIKLVINKFPKRDQDISMQEISQIFAAPVIGIIPDFPKIRKLNNDGQGAVLGRDNEFTTAIRHLANTIVPVFNKPIPPGGAGGNKKSGGLFSGIFRKER